MINRCYEECVCGKTKIDCKCYSKGFDDVREMWSNRLKRVFVKNKNAQEAIENLYKWSLEDMCIPVKKVYSKIETTKNGFYVECFVEYDGS